MNSGELSPRTFRDYFTTCENLIAHFGADRRVDDLRPDDFRELRKKLAARFSVGSLKNEINRVRILFNFAHETELIPKPVTYGQHFDRPSQKSIRRAKNQAGELLFTADEVRRILEASDPAMRAMVFFGLNCGFGNSDVANLPQSAIDLPNGWVDFPRVMTEIPRRIPLWRETVDAVKAAIEIRSKPVDRSHGHLVFLTSTGHPLVRVKPNPGTDDSDVVKLVPIDGLSPQFGKLLRHLGINGRRRLGFYTLRHCTQTIGGEAKDPDAVSAIMGHVDNSMDAVCRERISDERLIAVTGTIRNWLFADVKGGDR